MGDYYWYEPDYAEHREPFNPQRGWGTIEKHRRWAMVKMRSLSYAARMRRLLIRYATALSNADPDVAFLQMWSLLETITDTVGAKYDETIRRTRWIFRDSALAGELLKYLRCCRNQYVHAARSSDKGDQVALLAKSFIDPHLVTLLRNDFDVQSLEEYATCLSLPASVDELKRRHKLVGGAIRLRQRWTKRE